MDQAGLNNRSDQLNPNNPKYWGSRGYEERPNDWTDPTPVPADQAGLNNRSDQLNPNNPKYWGSRGYEERPDDWTVPTPIPMDKKALDNRSNQLNPNHPTYGKSRGYGLQSSYDDSNDITYHNQSQSRFERRDYSGTTEGTTSTNDWSSVIGATMGAVAIGTAAYSLFKSFRNGEEIEDKSKD